MPIPSPDELRDLRRRAGLTQAELARRAGVSQSLIARIEGGKVNPRVSTLIRIYRALENYVEEELTAEDIMSSPVISVTPDTSLEKVATIMWSQGFSQLPVIDNDDVLGTVFERDIVRVYLRYRSRALELKAKNIMSDPLPIISAHTKLRIVAKMLSGDTPALLVAKGSKITGIITRSDIARLLVYSRSVKT